MQDVIDIPGQPTLTAHEYAEKYNISRRTVTRYIKQGKLEAVRRKGRTHVIDLEPSETPIETEHAKKLDSLDSESGQLVRHPDDYIFRLGQLTVQAKAGQRWKLLSVVLVGVVFLAAPSGVWLYLTWQGTANALSSSQETLATATINVRQLQDDLVQERTTAAELNADVSTTRIINQELQAQLQNLRDQLADSRKRLDDQSDLLARIQAAETQIAQLQEPTITEQADNALQDATERP